MCGLVAGEGVGLWTALAEMAQGANTEERPGANDEGEEDDRGCAEEQHPEHERRWFFAADFSRVPEECWGSGSHPGGGHERSGKDVILKPICDLR